MGQLSGQAHSAGASRGCQAAEQDGRLPPRHASLRVCFHSILQALGSFVNQLIDLAAEAGPSGTLSKVIRLPHGLTGLGMLAKSTLQRPL